MKKRKDLDSGGACDIKSSWGWLAGCGRRERLLGRTTSKMGFILVDHFTVTHLVHNNFLINIFC